MRKLFGRKNADIVDQIDLGSPVSTAEQPDQVGEFTGRRRNGDDTAARLMGFRISLTLNVVLGFTVFGLVMVLQMIVPLQRTIPFLVPIGDINERTISTRIIKEGSDGERILSEWEAARYVKYRYEIVPVADEMKRRWAQSCLNDSKKGYVDDICGYVYLRSSDAVYKQFLDQNTDINTLIKQGISRVVNFDSEGIFKGYRRNAQGQLETQWEFRITVSEFGQPKGTALFDCSETENQNRSSGKGCFLINSQKLIVQLWAAVENVSGQWQHRFLNQAGFKINDFIATPIIGNGA
ncbi:hypothetical protein [Thalassospira lucentensis]|uniref:hypothetical protein n=1 Tax=Thalassospira lucentensis TaxID=168935 RepID=UPI0029421CB8|nr:hypothetical protein [Thalassospira lucentensis]WOI09019.1 hypothetical protein R1T41_00045 [Thalassospira lucentensis]